MFSRRHFLQLSGIALASAALPVFASLPGTPLNSAAHLAPTIETIYGRAFGTTRVYALPTIASSIETRLWENSVAPILAADGDWYRLPEGYVLRRNMQPMIAPLQPSETTFAPPFWAEVSGAIATVYASCAVDTDPLLRIGHGGILHVIDWLPGDGLDWYGVADSENGALLGWTQTAAWSPVALELLVPSLTLAVDSNAQQMSIRDGDHLLLTAPISTGRALLLGVYPISGREMSRSGQQTGAPWVLHFGDNLHLSGVYWHNRFGTATPGAALQATPALARWLYPRANQVIIA